MNKTIKILTINIGNPSKERAKKQVDWIKNREEDIFFLTETKNSDGCNYIANYFLQERLDCDKLNVSFPQSKTGDYGVMCLSKMDIVNSHLPFLQKDQYHCRFLKTDININGQIFNIICLYVPSRDQSYEKIMRKKLFLERTLEYIKKNYNDCTIICGDLNIVDRNHVPRYSAFKEWEYKFYDALIELGFIDTYKFCCPQKREYSWVGRTGNGYRYDYFFVYKTMSSRIIDCCFVHEPRIEKLTDHSAIRIELAVI